MQINSTVVARYGGKEAMEARAAAFAAALNAHRLTVDVPAPVEDELIERIARAGESVEPFDPDDEPGEKGPSRIDELQAEIGKLRAALIDKSVVTRAEIDAADPDRAARA